MRIPIVLSFLLLGAICLSAQEPNQKPYCEAIGNGVEHGATLSQACEFVESLHYRLPNFICDQQTERYELNLGQLVLRDVITAQVTHDTSGERYSEVKLNHKPTDAKMSDLLGMWSVGEFGADLQVVFEPQSLAKFKFVRATSIHSTPVYVYEFRVAQENNTSWTLYVQKLGTRPGLTGKLSVRQQDGAVLQFDIAAADIAPQSYLQRFNKSISYEEVALGDGSRFVLPTASTSNLCPDGNHCSRSLISFRHCHKFAAKSRIVDDQDQKP